VNDASSAPNIAKKKDASPGPTQNPTTMVAEKTGSVVFYPKNLFSIHFDLKRLENIIETLLNQYIATKKAKKSPKNPKSTRNKNSFQAQMCCFRCFQGKKNTHKRKLSHHMEPFDIKIDCFCAQNLS